MSTDSQTDFVIAALYKFASFPNFEEMREELYSTGKKNGVYGSLLIAKEGINGTIASSRSGIDAMLAKLRSIPGFEDLEYKESYTDKQPFLRFKIRLKKEIVTMGVDNIDPNLCVGKYVMPESWNDLIQDPEVILIDTRNRYETKLGVFEGAVDPEIDTFREFPDYVDNHLNPEKHKRVAMYCTGGIRCEKATSLLLQKGFEEVYHLKGGILKYLEEVPEEQSTWKGECFVFDERVAVDHHLNPGDYELCRGCRNPMTPEDKLSPHYEYGICCPVCYEGVDEKTRNAREERNRQEQLAKERGEKHLGREVS